MACATFGLVMGGIIGGPVAERLINRHGLRGTTGIATYARADRTRRARAGRAAAAEPGIVLRDGSR